MQPPRLNLLIFVAMAYFSETAADGHTVEGRIGEACCPGCGMPVLAKYSLEGELLEEPPCCSECLEAAGEHR